MSETKNQTEKSARWKDYRDLIPGFSSLNERVARALFGQISDVSYQSAEARIEESNEVRRLSGIGFIQVGLPHGYILMAPDLKRAFVYAFPEDATTKGAADALLTAVGWVDYSNEGKRSFLPRLVVRDRPRDQKWLPPYYALGKEIEAEVRAELKGIYRSMPPLDERPYFVGDLINYYAYQMDKHGGAVLADGKEVKREYESAKATDLLIDALQSLEKAGIKKITFAKAKPEAYEQAVERMAALLRENGVTTREQLVFRRAEPFTNEGKHPPPRSTPELEVVRKLLEDRRAVDAEAVDWAVKQIERLRDSNVASIGYKTDEIAGFKSDKGIAEDEKAIVHYILDRIKKTSGQEYDPGKRPSGGTGRASKPSLPGVPVVPEKGLQPPAKPFGSAIAPISPALRSGASSPVRQAQSGASTSTTVPPVRGNWQRAKTAFTWAKARAPALIVGGIVGVGIRVGAQFVMAAFITTTPGIAVVIGSAMIAGAAAGAGSRWVFALASKNKEEGWQRKALVQGALFGALGGGIGTGAMQWLMAHGYFEGWFGQARVGPVTKQAPVVKGTFLPEPGLGAEKRLQGSIRGLAHPTGVDIAYSRLPTWAAASLTPDQYARLPAELRRMTSSSSPREICFFCKEASYLLFNGPQRGLEGARASGAMLLAHGVQVARDAGLSGPITHMLNADLAYVRAWGIGAPRNLDEAIACARRAGDAVNNYGPRLLRQPHILRHLRLRQLVAA